MKKPARMQRQNSVPKECIYCKEQKEPWFSEGASLNRFLTERGKIIGRSRNGLCAMHQRHLTLAIKYARQLALLPFVVRS